MSRRLPAFGLIAAFTCVASSGLAQSTRALSEREAVREALRRSPTAELAELSLRRARQDVLAEQGRYSYVLGADLNAARTMSARLGPNDSVLSSTSRSVVLGTQLSRTYATGTVAEIRLENEYFDSEGSTGAVAGMAGSGFGATARASMIQPLLRGAGTDVGEVELRAARVSQRAAQAASQRIQSELARDTLNAYWELWYAERALAIERAALGLAQEQERQARDQLAEGALAPVDVLTFTTRSAQLEESVVQAELQRRQRALTLSQQLGSLDERSEHLAATSNPPPPHASMTRAAVEAALRAGSVELAELEQEVKLAQTRAEVAGEAYRPRLDLSAYVQTSGVSEELPRAWSRAAGANWWSVGAGLTFELPLDNQRKDAERTKAQLAVLDAKARLRAAKDRIAAEAARAVADETAAAARVAAAERTLKVAREQLAAQRERFRLGEGIPIQVQQAEEDVRRAELRLAALRVDFALARATLLHLTGQLLPRYQGRG